MRATHRGLAAALNKLKFGSSEYTEAVENVGGL